MGFVIHIATFVNLGEVSQFCCQRRPEGLAFLLVLFFAASSVGAVLKTGRTDSHLLWERESLRACGSRVSSMNLRFSFSTSSAVPDGMGDRLGKDHGDVLNGGKLFFGVAQKALNIYLKYLWCSNFDVRPPHCPFDYDIISRLNPKAAFGAVHAPLLHCNRELCLRILNLR